MNEHIVITSLGSAITVRCNGYKNTIGFSFLVVNKRRVAAALTADESFVELTLDKWILAVSYNEDSGHRIVESVDGNVPTSNMDLMEKLSAIMG